MGTMFLPREPLSHTHKIIFKKRDFKFFSSKIMSVKNGNQVTHIILLLCCGRALGSEEVITVEVFVCDVRPLLLPTGSSVLVKIQPATQMDTEKIHMITKPCHCHCALLSLSTWLRKQAHMDAQQNLYLVFFK